MIIRNLSLEQREQINNCCSLLPQTSKNFKLDPRETMKQDLPEWIQPLLTELVAKPHRGEKSRHRNLSIDLVLTYCILAIGITLSFAAVSQLGTSLAVVLLGWVMTTYALRKLRLTIMHAASHYLVFANNHKLNRILGEFISILTLTPRFKVYQRGHNGPHHSNNLLSPGDETYEYLFNTVGFSESMTVDDAWKHLWKTLFSPSFYVRQFGSRLAATFWSNAWSHNWRSLIFWLIILAIVVITHSWLAFFIAWLVPIFVFFEASSLLRQCVEHRFVVPAGVEPTRQELNQMTVAIFCGEVTPQLDSSASWIKRLGTWTKWWLRMLFYHLPARLLILTGDSPCHDWHHRNITSREWIDCIFARQKEVERGEKYYESWGLLNAIDKTFKSLSTQTPSHKK
jgi:hypothetical protein